MTSFDKKKAAEFFIVAWVKDWRMKTYLQAIGFDGNFEDVHEIYPWMPDQRHFYIKDQLIRAWTGMAMRAINDKLWDTEDNKKRLALAMQIENWDSDKVSKKTSERQDANQRRSYLMKNRQSGIQHKLSVETMRRGSGHHWGVVK